MNHQPTRIVSATGRPLTRRALAKQQTREKVLDAAKRMFTERGYEGATIRDIAAAAGMSTGAVFASFTDKADLFEAVLKADQDVVAPRMERAGEGEKDLKARLVAMLGAAYGFHFDQLPLVQASIGVAWTQPSGAGAKAVPPVEAGEDLVRATLDEARTRGELSQDADVALLAELIWTSYLGNYRRAVFDGWDQAALRKHLSAQIDAILAGARKG